MYSSNVHLPHSDWEYHLLNGINNLIDRVYSTIKRILRSTFLVILFILLVVVFIIPYVLLIYPISSIFLGFTIRRVINSMRKLGTTVNKDNYQTFYFYHKDLVIHQAKLGEQTRLFKKHKADERFLLKFLARKLISYDYFLVEYIEELEKNLFYTPEELGWSKDDIKKIKELSKSYPEDLFTQEDEETYDIEYNKYVLGLNE